MKTITISLMLLIAIFFVSCGRDTSMSDSVTPIATEETTNSEAVTEEPDTESIAEESTEAPTKGVMEDDGKDLEPMEMMRSVLLGKHSFIDVSSNQNTDWTYFLSVINPDDVLGEQFECHYFLTVDFDNDGIKEVVMRTNLMKDTLVFHYEDGSVYMNVFNIRDMNFIYDTGIVHSSGGAHTAAYCKVQFTEGKAELITLANCNGVNPRYYIGGEEVSEDKWNEFIAQNCPDTSEIEEHISFTPENIEKYIVGEN